MTLGRSHSSLALATRSLGRASAALILLLAALPVAAQKELWVRQFGTTVDDDAYAAAPDGSGGVYVGGATLGPLGGPKVGSHDAWLARYDSAGNQVWIRQIGSGGGDYSRAAAPDGSGGVYIGGNTGGNLGGTNAGGEDGWLGRYDATGKQVWIRQLGTNGYDYVRAAAQDGSGGVYIAGETGGSLAAPQAGFRDAWFARYDGAGHRLWIHQIGGPGYDIAAAVAEDGSGGVYVSGTTRGSLGGQNAGETDAWLARYDGAGNQLWILQLGTDSDDGANAAAPNGSGGVYVSGNTRGSLGGPLMSGQDVWVALYDGGGNPIWIRQLGSSPAFGGASAYAAAPDGSGGVYVGGFVWGNLGGLNTGSGRSWLARYDGGGSLLWLQQFGTIGDEGTRAAATDGLGGVHACGPTWGSIGGMKVGGQDAWLTRYGECGSVAIYCTAKANSSGCVPAIAASGTPSASAGSGFTIQTSDVLDDKFGLYFYSKSGADSLPFQGGTLCAQPPLVRTMLQSSGGTAPCGGMFQIDFNAWVASGNDPGLSAGQKVWVQTWSRDPGFAPPDNTSLSDAVTFTLCP